MKRSKKFLSILCSAILTALLLAGGAMLVSADTPVTEIAFGTIHDRGGFGMYGSNDMQTVPKNSKDPYAERYAFFFPDNLGDTSQFVVQKALTDPVDLTTIDADMNNVNLTFWLYVSDASALPRFGTAGLDSTVEVGSGSAADDSNELSTPLLTAQTQAAMVDGWNRFSLPVGKLAQAGTVDTTAVKFVRMYITSFEQEKTAFSTGFRMGLTDVRFVKADAPQSETVKIIETEKTGIDESTLSVVHASDKASDLSEPSASVMDGTFSPSADSASRTSVLLPVGYGNVQTTLASPVDASALGSAAVGSVWFYINDVTKIIEATDAAVRFGESDTKCAAFSLKDNVSKLKDGWNHIIFNINQNGVDLSQIKFFRIYIDKFGGIPGLQFGFNNACVAKGNNVVDSAVIGYEQVAAVDGEDLAFGKIRERTADYVVDGKMFGMYGSADREIAPGNSNEKFSELYAFGITDTTPSQFDATKVLKNPLNLSSISTDKNKIGLSFWLYITDPSVIPASGDSKIMVFNYNGAGYETELASAVRTSLVSGWNKITVALGGMNKPQPDTVNLKAIDAVRLYLPAFDIGKVKDSTTGFRMGLTDVRFVYTEQAETVKVTETEKRQAFKEQSQVVCDTSTFDGLDGGSVGVVSTTNVPKGSFADSQTALILNPGYGGFSKNLSPAIDMSGVTFSKPKMAYSFWYYVNDVRKLKTVDSLVEITSGGTCDVEEVQINLRDYADRMVNGWNHFVVNLGLYDANPVIDVSRINYTRLVLTAYVAGLQIGFHDLRIVEANTMEQFALVETQRDAALSFADTLDTGDSAADWTNVTVQNTQAVGAGNSLKLSAAAAEAQKTLSFDLSAYDEGKTVASFWMFAAKPALLTSASFKLGSAADKLYAADLPVDKMKPGWTQFEIKLSELKIGDVDKTAISLLKFEVVRGDTDVAFDQIEVAEKNGAAAGVRIVQSVVLYPPAPPDPTHKVDVGTTSSSNGFGGHAIGVYDKAGPDGYDAIFGSSIHNILIEYKFPALDITETVNPNNAVLTFWLYLNDVSRITGEGAVDLCSSENYDGGNRYSWHFGSGLVGTGADQLAAGKWNKLTFPIGGNTPAGAVDLSSLKYLRVFNIGQGNRPYDNGSFEMKMMIAGIQIVEADVSTVTSGKVVQKLDFPFSEPTKDEVKLPTDLSNGVGGGNLPASPHPDKVVNNTAAFKTASRTADILMIVLPAAAFAIAAAVAVMLALKQRKS